MSKILIILHQKNSTPGRLGEALVHRGYTLDIKRPRYGDVLPGTMQNHAGAIIFGGPMFANDGSDFIRKEIDWIHVPLREDKPFLGICLGAHLLAKQLGARVRRHRHGCVEAGYYPIRPTMEGRKFIAQWPARVYQWHHEGFDIPHGARLLARGELFRNQAMAYGQHAFGLQFHPELTLAMMNRWTCVGAAMLEKKCAQPKRLHFYGRSHYDSALARWLDSFLDTWLKAHPPIPASQEI